VSRPGRHTGWIVLFAGFVVIAVGYAMRNTFTVFYPVLVHEFGWTRGVTAIMFSIALLTYGFVAPVAGGLVDHVNPRLVLATGGILVSGGIALCSLATETWHFYLLFGVLVAVGLSLIGVTPLSTIVADWFPKRRALVFSIIIAGFGTSLVTAPVFQALISRYGWQHAYVIIGAAAAAIIIPLVLLVIRRNRAAAAPAPAQDGAGNPPSHGGADRDWTLRTAWPTRPFRIFLVIAFCNMGFAQQFSIAHGTYMLLDLGYGPETAASAFGTFGIAFAAGTLVSATSDRFGRVPVFVTGCAIAIAGLVLLMAAGSLGSIAVAVTFCLMTGFGLGTAPPTAFAAAADRFHGRNYGTIQGTLLMFTSVGGAVGPWAGGALHDISDSYRLVILLDIGLVLLSGLLMWRVQQDRRSSVPLRIPSGAGEAA
jgi:MFS family permease